jgi:hypothetical protein
MLMFLWRKLIKPVDSYIEKSKTGYPSRIELISEAIKLRLGIARLKE